MSRILSSKKRYLLGVAASLVVAVAAMAYWTAGGGGDGSGGVADAASGEIAITGVIDDAADFRPGTTKSITLTATNTDPATDLHVTSTEITGISIVDDSDQVIAACDESWFTGWSGVVAQGQTIQAADADDDGVGDGSADLDDKHSITFENSAADQDACKGATVKFEVDSL